MFAIGDVVENGFGMKGIVYDIDDYFVHYKSIGKKNTQRGHCIISFANNGWLHKIKDEDGISQPED